MEYKYYSAKFMYAFYMHHTPTSSIGELSYTYSSMFIRCMAITTPHTVSTTGLPSVIMKLAKSLLHWSCIGVNM